MAISKLNEHCFRLVFCAPKNIVNLFIIADTTNTLFTTDPNTLMATFQSLLTRIVTHWTLTHAATRSPTLLMMTTPLTRLHAWSAWFIAKLRTLAMAAVVVTRFGAGRTVGCTVFFCNLIGWLLANAGDTKVE